jgi:hypothetical protein
MFEFPRMFWDWLVKLMTDGDYAISWLINGGIAAIICVPLGIAMLAFLVFGNSNGTEDE